MSGQRVLPASLKARLSPWSRAWATTLRRRGHPVTTCEGYLRHITRFETYLQDKEILGVEARPSADNLEGWHFDRARLTYSLLVDYMDELEGLNPRTVKGHFVSIGGFLKFLHRHHDFPSIDVERFQEEELAIVRKKVKKMLAQRTNTPPTAAQLAEAIQLEPDLRARLFVMLTAKTGARRAEILSLDWSDIDFDARTVRFKNTGQHAKRTFFDGFIDAETVTALRLWQTQWKGIRQDGEKAVFIAKTSTGAGARMTRRAAYDDVKRAFARVGTDHNVHSLRHWFTDTLRANGMPDHMIAYLRGDAPRSTLDTYTHLQSEAGRQNLRVAYDAAMPSLSYI